MSTHRKNVLAALLGTTLLSELKRGVPQQEAIQREAQRRIRRAARQNRAHYPATMHEVVAAELAEYLGK